MSKEDADKIFNEMDIDKNGTIDENEFVLGLKKIMGEENFMEDDMKAVFIMCDKCSFFHKRDNKLDKEEFARVVKAIPQLPTNFDSLNFVQQDVAKKQRVGTFMFNIIDEDSSNTITLKELEKFITAIGKKKEDATKVMNLVDKDKSKTITLDEFLEWYCDDC
ncbi:hypothetical protein EIN_061070 [Entamoeba invadens IP1]|uniref:hypothetical protein n=1 Tax=Entamoeba invadens IP1 TaxID=370355 RepID=UPI0002C3FA2C|nr:hypothetical protein EIN_061070 [Entamoeba invadens IP1]ELP93542.1 hypothetical protein EIN_061070 [Entamoeba invadens IP1]|eukprot:XP_004260313.1 hypothetical protein EIN_061070 [Entamoeba invadens IP1]